MEEEQLPPQVSVLIGSFNNAGPLRRCLASLEQSNERDKFEILVIDNASRDESPRLDSEFPNATFLRLPRYFGLVKALNIGMRTAKGDFFLFLAPEAEVLPDTVPALAAQLGAHEGAAAVCPLLVDPQGQPAAQFFQLPAPGTICSLARRGSWVEHRPGELGAQTVPVLLPSLAALMVRSYFLKALRYIDERYGQSWANAEIATQIRRASKKILLCPEIRAVLHPDEVRGIRVQPSVEALFSADWALAAATYAGKHYGFTAGLKVRFSCVFHALGQAAWALLRFRDVGYHFSRFSYLLSGQKLDGTQKAL